MNDASPSESSNPSPSSPAQSSGAFRWHIVVGVLGLLYGVGGMLLWLFMAASAILWKPMMKLAGVGDVEPPPGMLPMGALALGLVIVGGLLVIGSAMVLAQRPRGLTLLRAWAFSRLVLVAIGLALGIATMAGQVDFEIRFNEAMRDKVRADGGDASRIPDVDRESAEQKARYMTLGFAVVLSAFPIFIAILTTSRRKIEEVETWHEILR
ncbi:MAG: hypothetical protein SGJ11_02595 [Phycisphaerae bacterium]|nr:hypothetical protein [Phycisphaerae bacterium]